MFDAGSQAFIPSTTPPSLFSILRGARVAVMQNQGLETHLIGICFVLGLILDFFSLFRLTVSPVGYAILAGATRAILELPPVTLDCQPWYPGKGKREKACWLDIWVDTLELSELLVLQSKKRPMRPSELLVAPVRGPPLAVPHTEMKKGDTGLVRVEATISGENGLEATLHDARIVTKSKEMRQRRPNARCPLRKCWPSERLTCADTRLCRHVPGPSGGGGGAATCLVPAPSGAPVVLVLVGEPHSFVSRAGWDGIKGCL
ncbi:hypothetical protein TRIATDRAFT_93129 [Trichoderma atroviride IMI 206040]|uniref:Uncharacterized protein n=1 Tax=Hypocrea atroviridis (strain ATCC 20476 / IMI 206040) TaxID=452589 RepID=G9NNC3_HYPAI|nr:uncharacterized protein TRIATDRAFT_93129 [Trichoderma atroviride IMI 206040]EHK47572.1 hypothetical protein TRIATDRAFT_93129 [Trichoderma atroviride IMI 206040]